MHIHVLKLVSVDVDVDVVDGHASLGDLLQRPISEDRGLIHIVPGAVQVGSPMEILQVVLASPKLLSIRV